MGIVLGIDASRSRSGGAIAHLKGILSAGNPNNYGLEKVHVWSYASLLDSLPKRKWLVKHAPSVLEKNLLQQILWQRYKFTKLAKENGCNIVLNTDAGSVARFFPSVTMSRDALSYERGEMQRYGISKARLRLILLKHMQNSSLKNSQGCIFLTHYIAELIQQYTGQLNNIKVIPHGLSDEFRIKKKRKWPSKTEIIRLLYVSNIAPYKHQWKVVKAVRFLINSGYKIELILAGKTDNGPAQKMLNDSILECDPKLEFVREIGHVPNNRLPSLLLEVDMFVFASSCETISNTLLEGMASGLPIICSNRGPMPEVLRDAGFYFNPEDEESIVRAIENAILNPSLRRANSIRAVQLSKNYSWIRCSNETWEFIKSTYEMFKL